MKPLLPTPHHLVIGARAMLAPCLAIMAWDGVGGHATPSAAAAGTFVGALVLLQAAPRLRATDLLGALALFITLAEAVRAGTSETFDSARWQACIAVAGGMALLLRVQHLRSLARCDAYVPLRHLERRSALLGRSRAGSPRPDRTGRASTPSLHARHTEIS